VTTVPSSNRDRDRDRDRDRHRHRHRDGQHPLQTIVGELVKPTRERYEPLLIRGQHESAARQFDPRRFEATRKLNEEAVLLIDDTWTTGASANSAAAALKEAGAATVAVVVIGRHLNREWHENDRRIRNIAHPFDWTECSLCEKREERG
jgi:predicted phosphoribosyltransferase